MGVTQAELGKLLETGQVLASDFLPRFGKALKDEFGGSVNSLTQEINRLNSSWDIWKQNFSNSDGSAFKWITNGLSESAAAMRSLGAEAGITQKMLIAIGGFEFGAMGAGKFDTTKLQEQAMQRLAEVKAQRKPLEGQEYLNQFDKQTLADLKREEQVIRDQINALAVKRGKETGATIPDVAGDFLAQKLKFDERVKAYLSDVSNEPKAVKIAAAVEKENKAFEVAVAGLTETDGRYISALKAHKARVAEIGKADAAKVSEGQRLIDQLKDRLSTTENLTEVEKLELLLSDNRYKKATTGEKDVALSIAAQIDARKALSTELDGEIARVKQLNKDYDAQAVHLKSLVANTDIGKNTQNLLDEALAESSLRSGQIDTSTYDQIIAKLHEVKDEGKDTFKDLQSAIEGWGRSSADAIVEFSATGKLSFSSLANSIIKDMMRMIVQQNITGPLAKSVSGLASGSGSWFSGLFGGSSSTIPMQAGGGYANGGVFSGSSLHQYVNTVQTAPKMFSFDTLHGFAKGGVFAEAGPEAVMPLARDSAGRLGVRSGGAAGDVNISIVVNESGERKQAGTGDTKGAWTEFAGRIKGMIVDQITTEKRPGGLLYS